MRQLKESLLPLTSTAASPLWGREKEGIRCVACGHRCYIPPGRDGICKVRSNVGDRLAIPWNYVAGLQVDPIEKKPFFHALPGSRALSFGMLGCDFHCAYCQNWQTSQVLRDPKAEGGPIPITPAEIVEAAIEHGAKVLTSTYNEPLITSEWGVEIFKAGKRAGLRTSYVSNGNTTPEVLAFLRPHVDFYKIDLKGFDDKHYRSLGGVLANVLEGIREVYRMGFWLEIVTLIIPGFNDSEDELKRLTEFIASVSPEIPWHANAFHQDYKMLTPDNTSIATLLRAEAIGKAAGLQYVYLGNRPGQVNHSENTCCPQCKTELITRRGFHVVSNQITGGKCPTCQKVIPGVWG